MVNYTPKTAKDSKEAAAEETLVIVKKVASTSFLRIGPETTIVDAQTELISHGLPGSPIIDETGKAIGFLSERDCLAHVIQMKYHNDMSSHVSDIMSKTCVTINENDNIMKAIEIFSEKSFQILPVVNHDDKVVGLLSRQSVFRYIVRLKQQSW